MYEIGGAEIEAVARVIESRRYFRYRPESECELFEREFAEMFARSHALAVSSGTAALICGLAGLGIGPGDEVIVPAYTFISTALAPLAVGAVPIIVEVDESLTLDPLALDEAISPRTKAVIPVHMHGLPCNLRAILDIAERKQIAVFEDAAQACGGRYEGRLLGTHGIAGAFSFNEFKILSCGEGGLLLTDQRAIYERAMVMHDGGCAFFSQQPLSDDLRLFAGLNFRMNDILAAIGRVQLTRLDSILERLRADKREMRNRFEQSPCGVTLAPVNDPAGDCSTVLGLQFADSPIMRRVLEELKERGVRSFTPIDNGRHVYSNWTSILERRGSHHPARDPLATATEVVYSREMCPRTTDVLSRTLLMECSIERTAEQSRSLAETVIRIISQTT